MADSTALHRQLSRNILLHTLQKIRERYPDNDIEAKVISVPSSSTVKHEDHVSIHYDLLGARTPLCISQSLTQIQPVLKGDTTTFKMADALDHLSSGRTRIEWLSSLNTEFKPKKNYRRTSIICTIGIEYLSLCWRGC